MALKFIFENASDNCDFLRKTNFEAATNSVVSLDSELSIIECSDGSNITQSFSGYFPRFVQGENNLSIKVIDGAASITIKTPIARWIT